MVPKTFPIYKYGYTQDFSTQFRPLPQVLAHDTYYVDLENGRDLCLDEDL